MTTPWLTAGDDWELRFTVLKPDGSPYDLSGSPTIKWTLLDKQGVRAIESAEVSVTVLDALAGRCAVHVSSNVTTRLLKDMYGHALRIVSGGITATPFSGEMYVMADPWAVAVPSTLRVVEFTRNQAIMSVGRAQGGTRLEKFIEPT